MIELDQIKEISHIEGHPSILDCISKEEIKEKEKVLKYLKSGHVLATSPSRILDVISGERILGELKCLTDGEYEWRSDIIYYFDKYNLKLPNKFIEKALGLI